MRARDNNPAALPLLLRFFALAVLGCCAAAQICPSGGLTPNEEGCAAPLSCPCALSPLYGCKTLGGTCVGSICTGVCDISTTGWAIIGGVVLFAVALIVACACCCCGCCRGEGGTKVVYIAAQQKGSESSNAPFLQYQT